MLMFSDLQEQVAFNLMQFSLFILFLFFIFFNSKMVCFVMTVVIFFTACKFHGHIASF